jgi:hypothetical protein
VALTDDGSVSSRIPLVVLPDPEDKSCLQAWADVVADAIPLRLLLDTGTPRSAVPHIPPFTTRPRRLEPAGRGAFGAASEDEMLVNVGALQAGDLVAPKLMVQLQPEGWPHPGLLGMDILGSHRCDFHFDVPRIDLDSEQRPPAPWHSLTTAAHSTPAVRAEWGSTSLDAVWDTGAGATLVDQSWASRHPDIVSVHPGTGRGTDVTGAEAHHRWGTLAPCQIGNAAFAEQKCAVVDLSSLNATLARPVEVVIGLPLIAQAAWCMDYPRRRWTLWP